jgi:hypothetical protein
MSVVAYIRFFAICRPTLEGFFCVLCDYLSYVRHDNGMYHIVICKLLESFPKRFELLNTDMSPTLEDNFCVKNTKAFRDMPPIICVTVTYL